MDDQRYRPDRARRAPVTHRAASAWRYAACLGTIALTLTISQSGLAGDERQYATKPTHADTLIEQPQFIRPVGETTPPTSKAAAGGTRSKGSIATGNNTPANTRSPVATAQHAPAGAMPPGSLGLPLSNVAESVVGTPQRQGVFSLLGRQLSMRQDEPTAPEPGPPVNTDSTQARRDWNWEDSVLLRPFYMTDRHLSRPQHAGMAPSEPSGNLQAGGRFSPLFGQLTMSSRDDLRLMGPDDSSARSAIWSEQAAWDQKWTMPSIVNPFGAVNTAAGSSDELGGASLAAFQEDLDLPPERDGERGEAGQQRPGEPQQLSEAERVGEAPPEDNTLQFLRTATVLLEPGESQCDVGINYLFDEFTFPVLVFSNGEVVDVADVRFRIRELTVPLQYRIGLLPRVQGFIGLPVGWANSQLSVRNLEAHQNDGGIGDLEFGATIQLKEGNAEKPHVLTTVSVTAPTGGHPFGPVAILAPSAPSLGEGFWSFSANLLCVHTYDPLVFFYGVGMEHFLSRDFGGPEIDPGAFWNYTFGVGFAVNDRVTLSTRFLGGYVQETRVDRVRVLGTNIEPMTIRMAATISKPRKDHCHSDCHEDGAKKEHADAGHAKDDNKRKYYLVEPFVEFGITDAAVDSFFGVTWTF